MTDCSVDTIARALSRRWTLVLTVAAAFVVLRLAFLVFSPSDFECRALLVLPEFHEGSRYHMSVDEIGISRSLINVAETKQLVAGYWDELRGGAIPASLDLNDIGRIRDISVENVVGTEVFFILSIKITKDPSPGPVIAESILGYLRENDFVRRRYEQERNNLERTLKETEEIVASASAQAKREPGSGLSAIERKARLADLNDRLYRLRNDLESIHTFEFVKKPTIVAVSLKRRLLVDAVAFSVIGLVAGLATAMLLGRLCPTSRDRGGVTASG